MLCWVAVRRPGAIQAMSALPRAVPQVARAALSRSPLVQVAAVTAARPRLPRVQLFRRVLLVAASTLLVVPADVAVVCSLSVAMVRRVPRATSNYMLGRQLLALVPIFRSMLVPAAALAAA